MTDEQRLGTPPAPDPSGPERRFEALNAEHRHAVLSYATRLTGGDTAWAEDVTQETFVRAWRRIDRMEESYGSVRSWLCRVAHNLVMDGYRTARMRRGEVSLDDVAEPVEQDASDRAIAALVVRDLLANLPDLHRTALEVTFLRGHTSAEAAQELNVPVGTIKTRVFYGLRMLRAALNDDRSTQAA